MKKALLLLAMFLFLLPFVAFAQAEEQTTQPPMAILDDALKAFIGTWNGTGTFVNMKTGQEEKSTDTTLIKPILDNQFLFFEVKGHEKNKMGKIFNGKGYLTYDSAAKKYVMYWFDNEPSHGVLTGEMKDKVLNLVQELPDGGKWAMVYTLENEKQCHLSLQMAKPGEELKSFGEITYTRAITKTVKPKKTVMPYRY